MATCTSGELELPRKVSLQFCVPKTQQVGSPGKPLFVHSTHCSVLSLRGKSGVQHQRHLVLTLLRPDNNKGTAHIYPTAAVLMWNWKLSLGLQFFNDS